MENAFSLDECEVSQVKRKMVEDHMKILKNTQRQENKKRKIIVINILHTAL